MDNPKSNPNQKGLGWIPDYPDLRDYRLGSSDINENGRLKREERSKEIEQLAQNFTGFLGEFKEILDKIAQQPGSKGSPYAAKLGADVMALKAGIDNRVDNIQSTIFGDIGFESVNIYRQLRKGTKPKTPFSTKDFSYESDVAKRILELKGCLYFIFQDKEVPAITSPIENSLEGNLETLNKTKGSIENLKQPGVLTWLREETFCHDTHCLVELFQHCANIWMDGVVGLETYTALNKYLEWHSKSEKYKKEIAGFDDRFNQFFQSQNSKKYPTPEYEPNSDLLPVSLLLPTNVFEITLNQLELWVSKVSGDNDLFEEAYLGGKLKVTKPEIFKSLFQDKANPHKLSEQWIRVLSKDCFKESEASSFIAIFQKEFLLVEPIVSVAIKLITPLAEFGNEPLKNVVSEALTRIEQLFLSSNSVENREQSPSKRTVLDSARLEDVTKQFALQSLERVQAVFDSEIEFKIREKMSGKSDADATLYFYFLLVKLVRRFGNGVQSTTVDSSKNSGSRLSNLFEKQEIFEVTRVYPSNKVEFFKIPSLQIPLRRKTLESFLSNNSEPIAVRKYLFLPGVVDLSYWCSKIEDQGSLNSCTALAGVALLEYFANRTSDRYTDVSSLFLYKATRNLMNLRGDVGASVRETMKAMALFGVPPEEYWQYDESKVDEEPPSFCYSFAQNFQALKYFRLDYAGISREVLLLQIKAVIATGFPCVFGFTIYTSAYDASNQRKGWIPFPDDKKDRVVGGHSVVAVGYDDYKKIERKDRNKPDDMSEGAFLIRNSFGTDWGTNGYGWLPYDYVLAGLTADWWSLLKAEWFNDAFWEGVRGNQGPDDPGIR